MKPFVVNYTSKGHIGMFVSATSDPPRMLNDDDLNEVDQALLNYLGEGRVTPAYARARLEADGIGKGDYSRGYIQQKLKRLEEHSHARNLFDTGLYELADDPRDGYLTVSVTDAVTYYDEEYAVGDGFELQGPTPFSVREPPAAVEIVAIRPAIGTDSFGLILDWPEQTRSKGMDASYVDISEFHDAVVDGRLVRADGDGP